MDLNQEFKNYIEEYEDISKKLSEVDIASNHSEFASLNMRISYLTPIVEKVKELDQLVQNFNESQELIKEESDKGIIALAEEELNSLEHKIPELESEINQMLIESDPNDQRNAILEIRAGTGGEEAALFAGDLYRMYMRFAEQTGWKLEQLSTNKTGNGGFKEVICMISGSGVYGKLKYENGVHRVQRVPSTESSGRIHTSAVSVVVLPEVDDVNVEIKDEDIRVDVYRAGGPGGQSVNTTDSAVRITHIPTGIVVTCQDQKSQHKNKDRALSILKSKLYEIEQEKQDQELSSIRKSAIKSGDRSAKIRTYNFPQSRVTDHRIKQSWHNLSQILDGSLEDVIQTTHELIRENN